MNSILSKVTIILATIIILGSVSSCAKEEDKVNCKNKLVKATIRDFSGTSGCGFVLVLNSGTILEPLNLNESSVVSLVDGKEVLVSYQAQTSSMVSSCMMGEMVIVDCISEDV